MADLEKQNETLLKLSSEDIDKLEEQLSVVYDSFVSVDIMVKCSIVNIESMHNALLEISTINFASSSLNISLETLMHNMEKLVESAEQAKIELLEVSNLYANMYNSISSVPNSTNQQTPTLQEAGGFNWLDIVNFINEEVAAILFEVIIKKISGNSLSVSGLGVALKKSGIKILLSILAGIEEVIGWIVPIIDTVSYFAEKLWGFIKAVFGILKGVVNVVKGLPKGPIIIAAILTAIAGYFGARRGEEFEDLQKHIEILGEEEGRVAAGTGFMDKHALFQYDKQQTEMAILEYTVLGNEGIHKAETSMSPEWSNENIINPEDVMESFKQLFSLETWLELGNNIQTALSTEWNEFVEWWKTTGFYIWWTEEAVPFFSEKKWLEMGNSIKIALSTKWNEFVEWWKSTGAYKWWIETVVPFFSEENWTFSSIGAGLAKSWQAAVDAIKAIWNRFAIWINEKLVIKIDTSTVIGGGIYNLLGTDTITIAELPTFEIGGFPEDGLFMANHGELVGQFSNGKTVVANNEQIVSGIKGGVKDAVSEVLTPYLKDIAQNTRETANKDFTTYIGDKEIARASERGRRAMGLQLITEY